ncbi:MAG TPA: signal peptidase I [Methylomirabilota bacterium]|nr:signal peptidase I [Methylomirabilota bacterium]
MPTEEKQQIVPDTEKEKEKVPFEKKLKREIIAWLWVGLIFFLINGAVGQARVIPSGSMENTLLVGDHLIMSRLGYDIGVPFTNWHMPLWRNPHRQQIIIFQPPFDPNAPNYVKRVIGIPGDTVEIHDGAVWVNGKRLDEPYLDEPMNPAERRAPVTVPPNCYFVMGDNRANSWDSRFWGYVPRANIIGTPVIIYMSIEAPPNAWDSGQISERVKAYLEAVIHPSLIRWRRIFRTF